MALSKLARAGRIDDEAIAVAKEVGREISKLTALFDRALNFTAFMHNDPQLEFSQEDRTKYTTAFLSAMGALNVALAKLGPLQALQAETLSKADFVATFSPEALAAYATQFDS
jgi:hypothetical protein